jgi:hypothetical protein
MLTPPPLERWPAVLPRAAGLVILGGLALLVIGRGLHDQSGGVLGFVHGIDLIVHEAGHVVFGPFGMVLHILGGSLLQVLVPAAFAVHFWRQGQPGGLAVGLVWTGESLTDVAIYVADAQRRALPLLSDAMIHDWHYLLGRLRLLGWAESLGWLTYATGVAVMLGGLAVLARDLARAWRGAAAPGARAIL